MDETRFPRRRRSLFWPLALILLGLLFLLNNLGLLGQDLRGNLWALWPLLLVLIGVDDFLDHGRVAGPSLLIGAGVLFLLANIGVLNLSVWQAVASLWPLLIVAAGIDLVVGRRSWLLSLLGVVLVLALLIYAVGALAGDSFPARTRPVSYSLQDAASTSAAVDLPVGVLAIGAGQNKSGLLEGQLAEAGGLTLIEDYRVDDGRAHYSLAARGAGFAAPGAYQRSRYTLAFSPDLPLALAASLAVGELDLDLSELQVESLDASLALGRLQILLPQRAAFSGRLETAMGQVVVRVPAGVGLRVRLDRGLAYVRYPQGYTVQGTTYTAPDFETAAHQVELQIDLAMGQLVIQ
ncbi:MAG: LiaF transmembrane domain-containing protein [Chloroflexota bacterium]